MFLTKEFKLVGSLLLLVTIVSEVSCYNILFGVIFGYKSHNIALNAVAEELSRRGHEVTVMTSVEGSVNKSSGVREVFLTGAGRITESRQYNFFMGSLTDDDFVNQLNHAVCMLANETYQDPFVQNLIQNSNDHKYDVFVSDAVYNEFLLPLAHRLKIPTVYVSPSIILPHVSWLMNVPTFYSYVPTFILYLPGQMSLMDRMRSVYSNLAFMYNIFFDLFPMEERIIRRHLPDSPSLTDLVRNISFLMSNDHVSMNPAVPNMPYFVEVGGLHLKPPGKLPKNLEDFMNDSSDAGVVYFSLGSTTKGVFMPKEMRDKLVQGFARLKQKVLWKYEKPFMGVSANVHFVEWAPQNDLLAHQKLKLFITQGGGLSIQESGFHGCPMLGIPLSADQLSNVANVANAGFGAYLNWQDFTVDEFVQKVNMLIDDKRYKKNAMRVAALLRDRPEHPVSTAAYWIEYVVRHKGASHLRSRADNLNFFQYFLLDIIGIVLIGTLSVLVVIIYLATKIVPVLMAVAVDRRKDKVQ